jgi:hypothetical protein
MCQMLPGMFWLQEDLVQTVHMCTLWYVLVPRICSTDRTHVYLSGLFWSQEDLAQTVHMCTL